MTRPRRTKDFNMFSIPLVILAVACAFTISSLAAAADLPKSKISKAGLYLTADEARALLEDENVIFIDIRSRAEVAFLGLPTRVNVHIPYMVMPITPEFDAKKGTYKLEINPDFPAVFERYVKAQGLSRDTRFVLICRSGNRSARAASLLFELGYKNAYSVIDGYEGDKLKDGPFRGKRLANGWKNEGLEWSYKIDSSQVYPDDLS